MSTVHIDKGMAWSVPIGGFIANFIVGGLAKSFGIIIGSTKELYNSDAAPLTLAGGLIYTFMYCLSIVGILLCQKYGCRTIINIGATGCVISFICAFFAPNVIVWVIAIGGGVGISLGFIYSPIFVMIGRCFRKKSGMAMGLSVAGVSVGQIAFPALISIVIEKYSARGAFLVGAGIACHFYLTAALMPRYIAEEEMKKIPNNNNFDNNCKEIEKVPLNEIKNGHCPKDSEVTKPLKQFKRIHIVMLTVFVSAKIFGDIGDVGIAFALPEYGKEQLDMTNTAISRAIAVAGFVDLISRIFIGLLSDQRWCRRSLVLCVAWFLESINTFFFVWFPYLTTYYVCYGVFGLCSGTAITLMTVVLTDLVGQDNMPISFGIMMFSLGLVIAGGQFLVGYLADVSGTYIVSMKFLGYNMLVAFVIMCLEYPIKMIFFKTSSAVTDRCTALEIRKNKSYPTMEENEQLVEILNPSKELQSRSSSVSTISNNNVIIT